MWNEKRYQEMLEYASEQIQTKRRKPFDFMMIYKDMIEKDDFEAAKAIDEVLRPLNYFVEDTHKHIKCLNP